MRVFLNANILFSAAKSSGAMGLLLSRLRAAGHTLVADQYVADEARRNLEAKFPTALADFQKIMTHVEASAKASGFLDADIAPDLPGKDRPVLAAAIRLRCDVLLTGDKAHFGTLYGQSLNGVRILSPAGLAHLQG